MSELSAFDQAPAAPEGIPQGIPQESASSPQQAPPADEPTYEVTIGGQKQSVPLSELLKGYSRTADYTRKTQALASERQQYQTREQQYQTALREAQQILTNREILEQYLRQMGATPQQAHQVAEQTAPDEVLTYAQAQKLLEEREKALEAKWSQQQQGTVQQLQLERLTDQYTQTIDQKLDEIATKYPDLPKIPGMDFMLKQAVRMQQPKTVDQALSLLDQAADYYAAQLGEVVKARTPAPASPPRGIEPPRGAAPLPPTQGAFTSVTDPRLRDTVIADFERLIKR